MGRPALNVYKATVRLQIGIGSRIDTVLVGREKRADLIRNAVRREVERREKLRGIVVKKRGTK
jgi:hypothetical protein